MLLMDAVRFNNPKCLVVTYRTRKNHIMPFAIRPWSYMVIFEFFRPAVRLCHGDIGPLVEFTLALRLLYLFLIFALSRTLRSRLFPFPSLRIAVLGKECRCVIHDQWWHIWCRIRGIAYTRANESRI